MTEDLYHIEEGGSGRRQKINATEKYNNKKIHLLWAGLLKPREFTHDKSSTAAMTSLF